MTPTRWSKTATIALMTSALCLNPMPTWATCGGGGGGGMGGARAGGSSSGPTETEAYRVPWTIVGPTELLPGGALGVYWFPSSAAEAKASTLLTSRTLSVLSARCVSMALITPDNVAMRTKYKIPEVGSGAVVVDGETVEIGRVDPEGKPVSANPVEKRSMKIPDEAKRHRELAGYSRPESSPIVRDFPPGVRWIGVRLRLTRFDFEKKQLLRRREGSFQARGSKCFALLQGREENVGVRKIVTNPLEHSDSQLGFSKERPKIERDRPVGWEGRWDVGPVLCVNLDQLAWSFTGET